MKVTSTPTTPAQFANETWEVLDIHNNTATNSFTFTPSTPLTFTEYEKFSLEWLFQSAGSGTLQLDFNTAKTANWQYQGLEAIQTPALTAIAGTSQSLAIVGKVGASGQQCKGRIEISRTEDSTKWGAYQSECNQQLISHWYQGFNIGTNFADDFTNILLSSSGTGWNATGTIITKGLLRKGVP
jgi:hypothetical protein